MSPLMASRLRAQLTRPEVRPMHNGITPGVVPEYLGVPEHIGQNAAAGHLARSQHAADVVDVHVHLRDELLDRAELQRRP
jgi:hypothetical protein